MKVGLLGAGRIGALHAGVLAGDPRVEEILVGDADTQRAESVAEEVGEGRGLSKISSTQGLTPWSSPPPPPRTRP